MGFFFSPFFFLLPSPTIPLYHFCCEVVYLNPVGPFWAYRLFFFQWPSTAIGPFITSLVGSCVPFVFPLGIAGPFAFLRLPQPFSLTLHSYGPLLSSLGFPGPITLFLILGVYGLAINPLLSLLLLLWDCRGPFLLFHIIYCPWFAFFFFLFPGSFKPIYPSRPICLSHGLVIHYSCRLGLMGFLSICQLFFVRVVGLLFST